MIIARVTSSEENLDYLIISLLTFPTVQSRHIINKGTSNKKMKFKMQSTGHLSRNSESNQDDMDSISEKIPIKYVVKQIQSETSENNVLKVSRSYNLMSRGENIIDRSISVDSISMVLPERTRLRRQQRMCSQDLIDPLEDSLTRLNRLRAKISGALSEVKGVLKQYSTDVEKDGEHAGPNTTRAQVEQMSQEDGPVMFRFVRKIRRRSIFDENEENSHVVLNKLSNENKDALRDDAISSGIKQLKNNSKDNEKFTKCKEGLLIQGERVEIKTNQVSGSKIEADKNIDKICTIDLHNSNADTKSENVPKKCSQKIDIKKPELNSKCVSDELVFKYSSLKVSQNVLKDNFRRASLPNTEELHEKSFFANAERRPSDLVALVTKKTKVNTKPLFSNVGIISTTDKKIKKEKNSGYMNDFVIIAKNGTVDMPNSMSSITVIEANNNYKDVAQLSITTPTVISAPQKIQMAPMTQLSMPSSTDILVTTTDWPTHTVIKDVSLTSSETDSEAITADSVDEHIALFSTLEKTQRAPGLSSQLKTIASTEFTHSERIQPTTDIILYDPQSQKVSNGKTSKPIIDSNIDADNLHYNIKCGNVDNTSILEEKEMLLEAEVPIDQKKYIETKVIEEKKNDLTEKYSSGNLKTISSVLVERFPKVDLYNSTSSNAVCKSEQPKTACVFINNEDITAGISNIHLQKKMPELQSHSIPVKLVKVFQTKEVVPSNESKENLEKKKIVSKEITHINSVDKKTLINTQETMIVPTKPENCPNEFSLNIKNIQEDSIVQRKSRKVKKKVIIKRQQRKLSASETFFNEIDDSNKLLPINVETFEKPITYVTDDEEEDSKESQAKSTEQKPLKSCLKTRTFEVGDWVLYGERVKKTQVRWKKGQIKERITGISYKLDIDGKEVSAHISYIKHYTRRKVNFSGKEYLEIDYEQIAQEEQKSRCYSIWNMV